LLVFFKFKCFSFLFSNPFLFSVAALVIVKQPFPMIITKNKAVSEEDLEVRLLCGAATDIKGCSKVRASLVIIFFFLNKGARCFFLC